MVNDVSASPPDGATLHTLLGEIDRSDAVPAWASDAWLAENWASASDPHALAGILGAAKHPGFRATTPHWDRGATGADAIRAAVGRAITRAELVAGAEEQRASRAARVAESTATWPARRAELYARRAAVRERERLAVDLANAAWEVSRG